MEPYVQMGDTLKYRVVPHILLGGAFMLSGWYAMFCGLYLCIFERVSCYGGWYSVICSVLLYILLLKLRLKIQDNITKSCPHYIGKQVFLRCKNLR